MITLLLTYIAFLTLFIVGLIHHYEENDKQYKGAISDYKRALNIVKNAPSNAAHYTQLQLDNQRLVETILDVNEENEALKKHIKFLNLELAGKSKIEYESTAYNSNQWEAKLEYKLDEENID